ncbi:MAG: DUF1844 domain-containing protein [Verrucomicrobia bacterium]|nr:DUF1844 domain-containing protein [Verrucomicrobiota bacterium]
MNPLPLQEDALANATRGEIMSALFASLVMQQTGMAMMLLGRSPHPETGKPHHDIEGAKMFIDQLEMLEFKTRGNLDKREEGLLKQSLMELHLAFVEAMEQPQQSEAKDAAKDEAQPSASDATQPSAEPAKPASETPPAPAATEDESKKKFSKKY